MYRYILHARQLEKYVRMREKRQRKVSSFFLLFFSVLSLCTKNFFISSAAVHCNREKSLLKCREEEKKKILRGEKEDEKK